MELLDSHDLRVLKHEQPDDHHRDIYQHCRFLLLIRPGDWIVHVNAPEKGGYIAVPVIGTVTQGDGVYLYESVVRPEPMDDFRSMIPVDPVLQVWFSNRDLDPYGSTYESLTSRGRYHVLATRRGSFRCFARCTKVPASPIMMMTDTRRNFRQDPDVSAVERLEVAVAECADPHRMSHLVADAFMDLNWVHGGAAVSRLNHSRTSDEHRLQRPSPDAASRISLVEG